ncbi:tetratricopeptide repeat protein [Microcoleus sp. A2-C5]|uniref:tetratricopeptide repeat protein n=1 Tax=unclassified Microcoleus TaxID=2642155 RepID=UPI002FD5795F
MAQDSPEEQFTLAANDWDLEKLYKDLADAKREVASHKQRGLTEVEKRHLRGLLCGFSPDEIGTKLQKVEGGARTDISNTVYMYVKQLIHGKVEDIKITKYRCIDWLEQAGYKTRSSNSVESKPVNAPSISENDIDDLVETVPSHSPLCAEDFNNLGIDKANERHFQEAIENFDRAIKLNPDYADPYNNRANVRHQLGDFPGAREDYTEAILLNPKCSDFHKNRGIISCELGDYREAQADHSRAIQLDPNNDQAYNSRGFARVHMGDVPGALKDFTQAIELNPDYALAWNNRGDVYLESGNLERALEDYTRAAQLKHNNPIIFYNLGVIHYSLGNKEKALEDYNQAIQLKPDLAQAYQNRGIVHYELGYSQRADEDFFNAKNLYRRHGKEENYQKLLDIIEELQQED